MIRGVIMELVKNGEIHTPTTVITTSCQQENIAPGTQQARTRLKISAIVIPLQSTIANGANLAVAHPRLADAPVVAGELVLDVPNIEVARALYKALGDILPGTVIIP